MGKHRHTRVRPLIEPLEDRCVPAVTFFDFGDLPLPYATTLAEGGAQHDINGPFLGASVDAEIDGTHSALADGDDLTDLDDENGVTFLNPLVQGLGVNVDVVVAGFEGGAYLDAWIDFNQDGDFDDVNEQIFSSQYLTGPETLSFQVPL